MQCDMFFGRQDGEYGRDVAANRHESDMAEGEDAGVANEDEKAQHGDQLDQGVRHGSLQRWRLQM